MIRRSLLRVWRAKLLIVVTVALGAVISTAVATLLVNASDKVNQELRGYGANITLRPKQAAALDELYAAGSAATLEVADLPKIKTIFWAYNILDFSPFLQTTAELDAREVPVVGVWFSKHLSLPTGEELTTGVEALRTWWEVDGEWPTPDQALVGKDLAAAIGIAPGDHLALSDTDIEVAGVVDTDGEFDDSVILDLDAVPGQPGLANWVEVSALTTPDNELSRRAAANPEGLSAKDWETWYCTAYVSAISYQIEEALPELSARAVRQVSESEGVVLDRTQLLLLLVAALCLASTALGVAGMVVRSVLERSAEIGLLKAVGATDAAVLALILTETMLVAALGTVLGIGAGFAVAQAISWQVFGSGSEANPVVFAVVAAAMVAVVLLGSAPAVRMLRRLRPAEVLHG
ncbi:MAG: ABC transporter permease [Propionibacteriaceae bacterium]|jgi:putative ABC transport system permease protein|nr:ABC transporter permease [Propionibacteriaceae bacterium]